MSDLMGPVAGQLRSLRDVRDWRAVALFVALFALGEYALSLVGLNLVHLQSGNATWWPAGGFAIAVLALARRSHVPVLATTLFGVSAVANAVHGRSLDVVPWFALGNTLEALAAAAILTNGFRAEARLRTLEDCARLVVAAIAGALVIAVFAAAAVTTVQGIELVVAFRSVAMSHLTATLLVVPVALLGRSRILRTAHLELGAQWVALAVVVGVIFSPAQSLPLTFLVLPVMMWTATRSSPRTLGLQLLAFGIAVIVLTVHSPGPFSDSVAAGHLDEITLIVVVQALIVSSIVVVLPLTIALEQRRVALAQSLASEELFRSGFDESLLGMLLLRLERSHLVVVRANDVAARLLSIPTDQAAPKIALDELLDDPSKGALLEACDDMSVGAVTGWHDELAMIDGSWIEISMSPLDLTEALADSRDETVFTAQMVDITQRRHVEGRLTELSLHDPLTGLPNRVLLADRVAQAISVAERQSDLIGLLLVDLDNFKLVNDSAGHAVGDEVLIQVAERLTTMVRPGDTVARIGGDEFVILSASIPDPEVASSLAQRVAKILEDPIQVGDKTFSPSASIGISVGTSKSTVETLLRDADAAMYASKSAGKRRATLFSDEHRYRAVRTVQLEQALRQGMERNEFLLHVQPVVDLDTGHIVAGETLIRWQHPERGLLLPREWLDIAEQSSLIYDLGRWVLQESCRLAVGWSELVGEDAPAVHVNVSARQLDRGHLVNLVNDTLDACGLPGDKLVLELTETQLEYIGGSLKNDLATLRNRGVTLAADDFGTGYSPLTRVTDLPLDMLKIDRQFVIGIGIDPRATAVVQAVLGLGNALGLQLVAEGVETPAQAAALRSFGCPSGQGYLWSPPRPADSFMTLLRTQRRAESAANRSSGLTWTP